MISTLGSKFIEHWYVILWKLPRSVFRFAGRSYRQYKRAVLVTSFRDGFHSVGLGMAHDTFHSPPTDHPARQGDHALSLLYLLTNRMQHCSPCSRRRSTRKQTLAQMPPKRTYSRRSHSIRPDDSGEDRTRKKMRESRFPNQSPKPKSQGMRRPKYSGPISVPRDADIQMDDADDSLPIRRIRPRASSDARNQVASAGEGGSSSRNRKPLTSNGRDIFDPRVVAQVEAGSRASTEHASGTLYGGGVSNFTKRWLKGRKSEKELQPRRAADPDAPAPTKRQASLPGILSKITHRVSGEASSNEQNRKNVFSGSTTEASKSLTSSASHSYGRSAGEHISAAMGCLGLRSSAKQHDTVETCENNASDSDRKEDRDLEQEFYFDSHKQMIEPDKPPFPRRNIRGKKHEDKNQSRELYVFLNPMSTCR